MKDACCGRVGRNGVDTLQYALPKAVPIFSENQSSSDASGAQSHPMGLERGHRAGMRAQGRREEEDDGGTGRNARGTAIAEGQRGHREHSGALRKGSGLGLHQGGH